MSLGWESLPLLPLRCILEHLNVKDCVAALSVCRHWRAALLVYEGRKDLLKLHTKHTERNLFLARVFRKNVRRLHIYVDCGGAQLDALFHGVLPEFFDSVKLNEISFIGPSYSQQNHSLPPTKLKRIITESLIMKNSHCITKLAFYGCEMDVADDNDRFMHEQIEYYSEPLTFSGVYSPADQVLSRANTSLMLFSSLQHIAVDYEQISTEALETLSQLPLFSYLSLCITRRTALQPLDWHRLSLCYPNGLDVGVNLIRLPQRRFDDIIENVLVEGMALVSLKVLFCKTFYSGLISHVVQTHKSTLRELVWSDAPAEGPNSYHRIINYSSADIDACSINPFILLCWQCVNLRRLVIHGYWIWQYDIIGFVRLRKTLQHLEVSAIYNRQNRFSGLELNPESAVRVLAVDSPCKLSSDYVQQVNEFTEFEWTPLSWPQAHPALRARSTPLQQADYVLKELATTVESI